MLNWDMRRMLFPGIIPVIQGTAVFQKQFRQYGEPTISIPRDRKGEFEPIIVPKHKSRGLSIEKLVISLYAKRMSVSEIEDEMQNIYEINLSGSSISKIANKITQTAQDWQNRPLERQYLIVYQ